MSEYVIRRYGNGILGAISRGMRARPLQPPPRQSNNHRPDEATLTRLAALKAWRKTQAQERGVDPDVVCSNAALMALARRNPRTEDELAAVPDLGAWKRNEYGPAILQVLQSLPVPGQRPRRRRR
jgi:ribonuclease D